MRYLPNYLGPLLAIKHDGKIYINLLKRDLSLERKGQRTQFFPVADIEECHEINLTGQLPPPKRNVLFIVHEDIYRQNPLRKDLLLPEIYRVNDSKNDIDYETDSDVDEDYILYVASGWK